jgi:glucose/arabinose dehydrogenase
LGENFAQSCYGIVTAAFAVDDLCAMKLFILALLPFPVFAQQPTVAPAAGVLGRGAETLYGPMISAAVEVKSADGAERPLALRGILFRPAGGGPNSWACYDVDRRALAGIWPEAELEFGKSNLGTYKGLGTGAVVLKEKAPSLALPPEEGTDAWIGFRVAGSRIVFCTRAGNLEQRVSYEIFNGKVRFSGGGEPVANWPEILATKGERGVDDAAYVADRIALPDGNPWKCWMRPTGLDFLPDGRLALCTLSGDVWVVSGLDDRLENVTWRRFAGGLREPLGLRVVGDEIVVGCRDQITRLHDTNGDGEADFYESLNAGRTLVPNFHAFAYDLQTDRAGSFYFGTGGNQLGENEPWHAKLWQVSADGRDLKPIASGLRAPNGLTVGPDDALYVSDNQGHWIPSSKISRIRHGGFYGYIADPKLVPKPVMPPTFDAPMLYIPWTWDNSSGGGVFCPPGKFGPLAGRMLHTSFGAAAMFAVFEQRIGDVSQGAIVKFPLKPFDSGIQRARFGPDGAVYVCGVKGWQSKAVRDGCLARVRYTGGPVPFPVAWKVERSTMVLTFDTPLDPAIADDVQNWSMQQWNYLWQARYGSPDVSVGNPKKNSRDDVEISSATLSADRKTVTLSIPNLVPAMQFLVKANLKTATAADLPVEIAGTIHVIP